MLTHSLACRDAEVWLTGKHCRTDGEQPEDTWLWNWRGGELNTVEKPRSARCGGESKLHRVSSE